MKEYKMLDKLNEYQLKAVLDESNACIVNAIVGSGKTTVLTSKLIYLHNEKNIAYRDMIVLTFTNKAAGEIKARLTELEPSIDAGELQYFGTFHSVALCLLRDRLPIEQVGFSKNFSIITPDEELDLALSIIHDKKLNIKYKNRLKKRLETKGTSRYQDDFQTLTSILAEEKIRLNNMSFHDLLHYALLLLKDNPVHAKWIVIDEVQDSDQLQLDFISALKENDTCLFAVGDPNQVIYSWRGSMVNVFYTLKNLYNATELSLPINYRSNTTILQVAGRFQEMGRKLSGIRSEECPVIVNEHYDSFQDADVITDKILELHETGVAYHDIAIFYRLQNQSAIFEKMLKRKEIPFSVAVKKTAADIPVLNWLGKVFTFALNHKDIASASYVITDKTFGDGITPKAATKKIDAFMQEPSLMTEHLLSRMFYFTSKLDLGSLSAETIYEYLKLDEHLHPTTSDYLENKALVIQFITSIVRDMKETELPFTEAFATALNQKKLSSENYMEHSLENAVQLMTLHASKGLEFSHVFITGINNGLIPLHGSKFDDIEEERRLFFVGLTRAKDFLELSYYTSPDNPRVFPGPSQFLKMIPEKLIENNSLKQNHDLQDLKKQILLEKEQVQKPKKQDNTTKLVSHPKYGVGTVVSEDDMMITVAFNGYGEKEFMKAFSELTDVSS